MLIDENVAKLKFCPFGRGAMPIGKGSEKFASGINMSPSGALTHCEGSGCMLWETHQVLQEPKDLPCPDCDGKTADGCAKCGGKGTYTVQIPHNIGFCGAGFQGPIGAALADLNKTLAAILVTVRGQQQKEPAESPAPMRPTPPPNEEVQRGGNRTRDKAPA